MNARGQLPPKLGGMAALAMMMSACVRAQRTIFSNETKSSDCSQQQKIAQTEKVQTRALVDETERDTRAGACWNKAGKERDLICRGKCCSLCSDQET